MKIYFATWIVLFFSVEYACFLKLIFVFRDATIQYQREPEDKDEIIDPGMPVQPIISQEQPEFQYLGRADCNYRYSLYNVDILQIYTAQYLKLLYIQCSIKTRIGITFEAIILYIP
mgnify:CR=1 FL=1